MKKPVIATDVGGNKEMMVDNKTGFLVKEGSAEDIIEKISELIGNNQLSIEMGNSGLKFIQEEYNWEIVAQRFLKTIKKFI